MRSLAAVSNFIILPFVKRYPTVSIDNKHNRGYNICIRYHSLTSITFSIFHLKMILAPKTTKKPIPFFWPLTFRKAKTSKIIFLYFPFFHITILLWNNAQRNDCQTYSSTPILPRHCSLALYLLPVTILICFLKLSSLDLFTISLLLPSISSTLRIFNLWSLISYLPNTLLVLNVSYLLNPAMLKSRLIQLSTQILT